MLKRPAGGNSLDNHLRILKLEQSEWVLCDCEVKGLNKGFAHASMNIWSESGALMAYASQSIIFREFDFKK
jgi:acyl-CoA thioesterase